MDFINEQDRLRALAQLAKQCLETFFEVAAVLGAGQQRAKVQGVHHALRQQVRHLAINDALGQALGDGGLADTRLTHQQRVVLTPASEDLRNALDLLLPPYQRVDPPGAGQFVQVAGISIQRIARGSGLATLLILHFLVAFGMRTMPWHLGNAVGNVVDHVDTGHALLLEQEHGLAFLFAEDRHQHIGTGHFTFAGALHVEHGTLQHTLEA